MHARTLSVDTRVPLRWIGALVAAFLLSTPAAGLAQTYPDDVFLSFEDQPVRGYVNLDALLWTRNMPGAPLIVDTGTGLPLFSTTNTMEFSTTGAPAITVGHMIDDYLGIEGTFFGFYDWEASGSSTLTAATAPIAGLPFQGAPPFAFAAGDFQLYKYQSNLTNLELNMRSDLTDRFTFLWGFRYLNLDENFRGVLFDNTATPIGGANVHARNNLFGFQIGGVETFFLTDSWTLSLHGKVGIFGNAAEQESINPLLGERSASDARASVVGQLGIDSTVQLSRNIAFRFGYQVLIVDNVALAPNQIGISNWAAGGAGAISTNNELIGHGGNLGLEFTW